MKKGWNKKIKRIGQTQQNKHVLSKGLMNKNNLGFPNERKETNKQKIPRGCEKIDKYL